jgi:predicted PurR-regulated permease PerM
MTILGVRYAVAIAILAGIARLLPYIGAFTSNLVTALVAFFQASNHFTMEPWKYTAMVVILVIVADQIMDNIVVPRLMGESLGIPPAAILVAAIVAFNWLGLIGLVIAAPVLATLLIVGRYIVRKMFDQDPWPEPQSLEEIHIIPWARVSRGMSLFWENFLRRK